MAELGSALISFLCATSVLSVSPWCANACKNMTPRDTKNTGGAQRFQIGSLPGVATLLKKVDVEIIIRNRQSVGDS